MTEDDRSRLIGQLQRHEGIRLHPYVDTTGNITIGCGINISEGISRDESDWLQANRMAEREDDLTRTFPWFEALDSVRQAALVNIAYNLGLTRLLGFQHALSAMALSDYLLAAEEFLDSKWARQVGARAIELAAMIRTGEWQA